MLELPAQMQSRADVARWVRGLSAEQVTEMLAALKGQCLAPVDEVTFIGALRIEDKVSGGLIPFELWDCQIDLLDRLRDEPRLFALKSRQLGITWTVLAHLLYLASFWGNRLFLIASQTGDDAIDALHRLRILHGSVPEVWRQGLLKDNTEQIAFANGSRFESVKATKRAGRSKAPYAALADEFAFWDWPDEQLASLEAGAQRLYAVTTGNGPGDLAETIWRQAEQGLGRWRTVFYPWSAHPQRAAEPDWYRLNVTEAPEPRLAMREYAATPRDAFAAPEGVFFERWGQRNESERGPERNWPTVRAVDFGRRHPACLWIQSSPAGQPLVVAEFAPAAREASAAMTTQEFVAAIKRIDGQLGLFSAPAVTYCDPAGKAAEAQTGQSQFEVFQRAGLVPVGEASGIRDGCVRLFDAIADPELPLQVSARCPWLLEALRGVRPDKHRPDLYDQRESSPYQHVLDALRYWAVNRRAAAPAYELPEPAPGPASGLWGRIW